MAEDGKSDKPRVVVTKDGPYEVSGGLPLKKEIIVADSEGYSVGWREGEKYPDQENYTLCRCGKSKDQPFCDETHTEVGFDGTETARRDSYIEQADEVKGPELTLTDARGLCAGARFCDRDKGVWRCVEESDDPHARETAVREACNCPSGRLVVCDNETGRPIEPDLEPAVSLIEDPQKKVSGPIWLKGGVPVESADGAQYEVRNRVTLCRCGKSSNKPFCDGTHMSVGFNDGDESVK